MWCLVADTHIKLLDRVERGASVACFAVWCLAADTHIKLLDRVESGASFLICVFESDIAHQSVAVLCMMKRHTWCFTRTMCVDYKQCFGLTSVHLCASSLQKLSQYLRGTIFVAPYSMVWTIAFLLA